MSGPRISVIVPHYDALADLDRCLTALTSQRIDEPFEIVVADNNSPMGIDKVEAVVAGRARVVIATDRGAGPARNAGVAESAGALLAFTDCDCVPEPEWLQAGIAALSTSDFVGGRMTVLTPPSPLSGAEAYEKVFAFNNRSYVESKGFTVTANLFVSRAIFEKVGPFRVGVSEDLEWCHRARSLGYKLAYASHAGVGHPARRDWPELKNKWRRINAETHALYISSGGAGNLAWMARNWLLPFTVPIHVPRILFHPALSCGDRMKAVATLLRLRLWRFADAHRLAMRRH